MIDLYYWTSANAQKVAMFLEETGTDYRVVPLNVSEGEQYSPEFVKIAPNSKIPVIVDHDPVDGGEPIRVFESGAILLYLAEKTGRFLPQDLRSRIEILQWLFWQVGGLGPIGGQAVHFRNYAPYPIEYALKRYGNENDRLLGVLNGQLAGRPFILGEYSIADMACFPWVYSHNRRQQIDFSPLPELKRWFDSINDRPATERAYALMMKVAGGYVVKNQGDMTVEARRILFGEHAVAKASAP
jgi:GST-like protein